jgi:osmotically-inducible protein OsmY
VLDALTRDVVLARRQLRVAVLGKGLVELSGRVAHLSEVGLAGDTVEEVAGVDTVLNHLLVTGVDGTVVAVPGPSVPRAARR